MNVPPLNHNHRFERMDTYKKYGAIRLASIVKARWKDCGHDVDVWIEGNYTVKSNLVNGLPDTSDNRATGDNHE